MQFPLIDFSDPIGAPMRLTTRVKLKMRVNKRQSWLDEKEVASLFQVSAADVHFMNCKLTGGVNF